MANLSIGDKILPSVSAHTRENAKEGTPAGDADDLRQGAPARSDSVALSSDGATRAERAPSQRIASVGDALGTLQQLKTQLQERPDQALAAHTNIGATQAYSLLKPPAA
jgi:hypothetical protein